MKVCNEKIGSNLVGHSILQVPDRPERQMSKLLLAGSKTRSGKTKLHSLEAASSDMLEGIIGCLVLEIARNPRVKTKLLASLPVLGPDSSMLDSKEVLRVAHADT